LKGAKAIVQLPFLGSRLPAVNDLWRRARDDDSIAELLDLPFLDHHAGRLLFLHHEELFPTVRFPEQKGFNHITARYVPWLSDTAARVERRSNGLAPNPTREARYREANLLFDQFNTVAQNSMRDRVVLAGLKLVKETPGLFATITSDAPIDFHSLRKNARDYGDVNSTAPLAELLEGVEAITSGKKSAELLHWAADNVDLFLDMFSFMGDSMHLAFAQAMYLHYRKLLALTEVPEAELRKLILKLHHSGWLATSGPAFVACGRCPDGGTLATLRGPYLNRRIRCPLCSRAATVISALHVSDSLQAALSIQDGMLGATVGWHCTRNRVQFCHSFQSANGEEIDFLVEQSGGIAMIECKVHKLRGSDLPGEIVKDCKKLAAHLRVADAASIPIRAATCLLNLPAQALESAIRDAAETSTCQLSADQLSRIFLSSDGFLHWVSHGPATQVEILNALREWR
jgi:hypothetical protein